MAPKVLLPWKLSKLQSLVTKNKNPHFQPFKAGLRVLLRTDMVPILQRNLSFN